MKISSRIILACGGLYFADRYREEYNMELIMRDDKLIYSDMYFPREKETISFLLSHPSRLRGIDEWKITYNVIETLSSPQEEETELHVARRLSTLWNAANNEFGRVSLKNYRLELINEMTALMNAHPNTKKIFDEVVRNKNGRSMLGLNSKE